MNTIKFEIKQIVEHEGQEALGFRLNFHVKGISEPTADLLMREIERLFNSLGYENDNSDLE